jgi:hypothetical protein
MLVKKVSSCQDFERLAKEGGILLIETPTYIYGKKESSERNRLSLLADPAHSYTHPNLRGLLYFYDIFTGDKKLAKRMRDTFGWKSRGKPIGIIEYIARISWKIWEKIRRKLHLRGPFGNTDAHEKFYSLYVVSEKGEVEKKLADL